MSFVRGDAMMRVSAFRQVGGFDATLDDALVVGLRFELGTSWSR